MAEAGATTTPGWSFSGMLADPNFQLLLANMGKAADPEGVGGVIGGAAANMISSKAAQTALEKRDAARAEQIKKLIELHGGITAPDKPGINSVKATPAGSYTLDLNLPEPKGIAGTPEFGAFSQTMRDIATPKPTVAPVATTPTVPAPVQTPAITPAPQTAQPIRTAGVRRPGLDEIIPFY